MERLQGIAVSPGLSIGEVLVMDVEGFRIPRRFLPRDAVVDELERLDRAIAAATAEIERNRDRVKDQLGEEYSAIFAAHIQMLNDRRLRSELEEMIRQRHYSPEYSVSRARSATPKSSNRWKAITSRSGPATFSTSRSVC